MSDTIPYSLLRPIWEHVGLKDTEITGFKVDHKQVTFEVIMKLDDAERDRLYLSLECPLDREA